MPRKACVQAELGRRVGAWGQILGTCFWEPQETVSPIEATETATCWPFVKPSDGLEPSTPSLPSWNRRGKRGHARVTAGRKAPQSGGI